MKRIFCSQAHGSQMILQAGKPVVIQLTGQSRYYTFSKQNGNRQHATEFQTQLYQLQITPILVYLVSTTKMWHTDWRKSPMILKYTSYLIMTRNTRNLIVWMNKERIQFKNRQSTAKHKSFTYFFEIAWRSTLGMIFISTLFRPLSTLTTQSHR